MPNSQIGIWNLNNQYWVSVIWLSSSASIIPDQHGHGKQSDKDVNTFAKRFNAPNAQVCSCHSWQFVPSFIWQGPIRHPNANNPKLQKQAGMPTSQHLMNPENAKYSMSMLMLLILTIQEGFPFCPFLLSNCILTFSEAGSYPYESSSDTTNCKSVETTNSAPIRMI